MGSGQKRFRRIESSTRRGFLRTAAAMAAAAWAPDVVPCSVFGANAPGNRIHVGFIGCGIGYAFLKEAEQIYGSALPIIGSTSGPDTTVIPTFNPMGARI